ncbi:hypothetical protein QIS99_03570 [Streptomyces sp. B-S-A8]|uniref:Uncharacterized protein n=1 Tax=Streptomyces solicavernae TaxID=3043614 RepID=A0ABT6RNG1_9ACTN|nr:hypothetical protein [Streptomyces sp. B-S-A8]MDI3385298.1 hypothetical protein [Streptomyces sp. B-S-A8]
MSSHDPMSGYQSYNGPAGPPEQPLRNQSAGRRGALVVATIADVAAGFLGLWILLFLLDANQGNAFVEFVHGTADWLGAWAQDIFTMETEGLRVLLNYGLPAVIYLGVGHGIASRLKSA